LDSVTHIIMGAALGEAVMGKKIGRKAMLAGAFLKTFPDFDLLYTGLKDARMYLLYHRSYTHSFFISFLYAIPLAYIMYWLFRKKQTYKEWFWLTILCLWLHLLVDVCTNYGTRLFLPFTNKLYALNNMSIADLCLTIPILIFLLISVFCKNGGQWRLVFNKSILIYSCAYFMMSFVNKNIVDSTFKKSIIRNNFSTQKYMTNPLILNNIGWYGIVKDRDSLFVGMYSMLQKTDSIKWQGYAINDSLLSTSKSIVDVNSLKWFSNGYYLAKQEHPDTLLVYTIKFGPNGFTSKDIHETFQFNYKLYLQNGVWQMGMTDPGSADKNAFKKSWNDLIHIVRNGSLL
jgi:inner membrane protein